MTTHRDASLSRTLRHAFFVAAGALALAGAAGCDEGSLYQPCGTDSECARSEICIRATSFSDESTCEIGCRTDADCPGGEHCSSDGICGAGCDDDAHCGEGEICDVPFAILLGRNPPTGECKPGCRSDDECEASELCWCAECKAGCRSDDDCAAGTFCTSGILSCEAPRCEPLPEPIVCGSAACVGRVARHGLGKLALAPCCAGDGVCGLDVGTMGATPACQPVESPGTPDPQCPEIQDALGGTYDGCRLPDGTCGNLADSGLAGAGVGCVPTAR